LSLPLVVRGCLRRASNVIGFVEPRLALIDLSALKQADLPKGFSNMRHAALSALRGGHGRSPNAVRERYVRMELR
jgi:hypothetical protein